MGAPHPRAVGRLVPTCSCVQRHGGISNSPLDALLLGCNPSRGWTGISSRTGAPFGARPHLISDLAATCALVRSEPRPMAGLFVCEHMRRAKT